VVDSLLNTERELPAGSYTYIIPTNNINFINKKNIKLNSNRRYSLSEIQISNAIFERKILFFLGDYLFTGIKIIPGEYNTILVIEPTMLEGLTPQDMISLGETRWTLFFMPTGNYMEAYNQKSLLINSAKPANINLSLFNKAGFNKENKKNSWLIGFTENSNTPNLMMLAMGTMTSENKIDYFTTNTGFGSSILSSSRINLAKVVAINNTNIYKLYDLNTETKFSIPLIDAAGNKKNPVHADNILIFEKSSSATGEKLKFMHDVKVIQYFPNVYKIVNLNGSDYTFTPVNSSRLCAMVYYSNEDDYTCTFINPIADYMDYNSNYINDVINGTLPPEVAEYIPRTNTFNISDYLNSNTFPYSSLYKLTKLIYMLNDDPSRFRTLYEKLLTVNKKYITRWVKRVADMPGFRLKSRLFNNYEIKDPSKYVTFPETMVFLKITHSDNRLYPIAVWIDGERVLTPYRYIDNFIEYLYLPLSKVKDDSVIELEMINVPDNNRVTASVRFNSVTDYIDFPAGFDKVSSANTIFYNSDTGAIIPAYYFFNNLKSEMQQFLLVSSDGYMIASSAGEVILTGFVKRQILDWYKDVDPSQLCIGPIEVDGVSYINTNINIQSTDNYRIETLTTKAADYPVKQDMLTDVFISMPNFLDDDDINRFRVFVNGKFCPHSIYRNPSETQYYLYDPTKQHTSNLTFNTRGITDYETPVIVEYLPYTLKHVATLPLTIKTAADIANPQLCTLYLDNYIDRPFSFEYYDVYINGIKVNKYDAKIITNSILNFSNTKLLTKCITDYPNGSLVSIYEKGHDYDIYGNEYDHRSVIEKLSVNDPDFYQFMINKYSAIN
jgi:hypothetical protein